MATELIPYDTFARMRLKHYCVSGVIESGFADWEWMNGIWYCERIGFTWIGRLHDTPTETGGMEIDFTELAPSVWLSILNHIRLPLKAGMTYNVIKEILGEPTATQIFVADRKSYDFMVGLHEPYYVSCTVQDNAGLIFVSVLREDVMKKIETTSP